MRSESYCREQKWFKNSIIQDLFDEVSVDNLVLLLQKLAAGYGLLKHELGPKAIETTAHVTAYSVPSATNFITTNTF